MTLPALLAQWELEHPDIQLDTEFTKIVTDGELADLMRRVVEACIADVQTMYDAEPAGLDGSACNALLRALARLEALKEGK